MFKNEEFSGPISRNFLVEAAFCSPKRPERDTQIADKIGTGQSN